MFFAIEKFKRRVTELGEKRYVRGPQIAPFKSLEGCLSVDEHYTLYDLPEKIDGGEFGIGDFFAGRDRYLWMEKKLCVPEKKEGYEVIGRFDFGKTLFGTLTGFESLLYVNGNPYQGVDANHREVFFTDLEGTEVRLTFLLWTGVEGWLREHEMPIGNQFYHQCRQAEFAYLHKKTDELYYFTKVITESLELYDKAQERYEDLIGLLERVFRCIDWDGESFYKTVEIAHEQLMSGLERMKKHSEVTVHTVGHTHIDVAWLWRLKHTREKAQRSFSTVLRLMEKYDDYIFQQAQPQLYKYIKEDNPVLFEKIKERVKEGRWEVDGGMWVEADCNVVSGESLVRQILLGTRFFEQEFGKKCEYLWLPDVFGYSWALPQILRQCEIDTFMTTKISWNQYNTIPDDLFWWKGIDGTQVLTYFVNVPMDDGTFVGSTYNSKMWPKEIYESWTAFKNKELTKDVLVSYGFGDGGGGPTRDMIETRRALHAIPGMPNVENGRAGDFFRKIHENIEQTDRYVHTWDGELYLEYHRGTYTTQAHSKKTNRKLENKLAQTEWLSSLAYLLGGIYQKEQLQDSWECVLLHQFHDIIPGSSIHEVYADSHVNYEKAELGVDEAKKYAMDTLMQDADSVYSVYSTNSFAGKELVMIPECSEGFFVDEKGQKLPAQKTDFGYEVLVNVEPFAAVSISFVSAEYAEEEKAFQLIEKGIETPYYTITWNENGQLDSIYDKENHRSVLAPDQPSNVFEVYEDKPMNSDAWDIDIYYIQKMETAQLVKQPEVIELGSLQAVIRFTYTYRASVITQDMIVYRDHRRIDFKTHVDWHESHKLLKAAFYTDIRTTKATYDIQFGHIERPAHWNNSWDWAKFEVCGHKWADVSEYGYGISLLNNCKYGYSIKENAMKLSLLRSAKWPDESADMGEHEFTYSLLPHIGGPADGGTIESANQLNLPAEVVPGRFVENKKLVKVSSNQVQLDVVKMAEDGDCLVVRLHECRGGRANIFLFSEFPVKQIVPCNLLEHDCGESVQGSSVEFSIKPFEIKTFKLYL